MFTELTTAAASKDDFLARTPGIRVPYIVGDLCVTKYPGTYSQYAQTDPSRIVTPPVLFRNSEA